MALCTVYGTIINADETPMEGVLIYFVIEASSAISSTGYAVSLLPVSVITTSSGYFNINLIRNAQYIVTINALGFRQIIRIPNESSANLFSLGNEIILNTSTGSISDPPAEENW